ncbi:MAG: hypothetical protein OXF98_03655 [Rhodospirillaceae bacterium]|nr:hypothetical protein [Rhodospirillaceae bacterium]
MPISGCARLAVQDVAPAGLAGLRQPAPQLAVDLQIEEHHGARRVEIPDVVVDLLEMPAILARGRIHRDDRRGEQIVAGTDRAVEVRPGIAGREVDQIQRRVHRRGLPDRPAPVEVHVVVLGPGFVTEFAGARYGVERPHQRPVVGVIGLDAPAHAVLRARKTRHDQTVVIQRRAGDGETLLPAFGLG